MQYYINIFYSIYISYSLCELLNICYKCSQGRWIGRVLHNKSAEQYDHRKPGNSYCECRHRFDSGSDRCWNLRVLCRAKGAPAGAANKTVGDVHDEQEPGVAGYRQAHCTALQDRNMSRRMTTDLPAQTDASFLRRILYGLIISTITTGSIATYSVVKAGQVHTHLASIAAK